MLDIPGPKESAFLKLGIKSSKKKGSSLEGRDTYELFKSKKLVDVIFGVEVMGQVQVGNKTVHKLAKEYLKLRYKDLNLTCYQRSFCHHEIDKIEVFNGAAGRLEAQVYSDQIIMSTQYRDHVIESSKLNKELVARDSLTEFMNQRALKLETSTKYARSFPEKADQMNQRRHTQATAPNFNTRKRTCTRAETSTVNPKNEES